MSQRNQKKPLMTQPRQTDCTSQPDSMPMAGASPNAMSPHSPAPSNVGNAPDHPHNPANLAPAMKARRDAQSKLGLLHGRVVHDQGDGS